MQSALLLFAVLALTVYGQLIIKARAITYAAKATGAIGKLHYLTAMFSDVWVLSALTAAVVAGGCWMLAVSRLQIGYAYPFMALTFVFVPVGSNLFLGEPLRLAQMIGIVFILAGVTINAMAR
jgi:drug/metabolite transporter (DMT)-like permease